MSFMQHLQTQTQWVVFRKKLKNTVRKIIKILVFHATFKDSNTAGCEVEKVKESNINRIKICMLSKINFLILSASRVRPDYYKIPAGKNSTIITH